MAIIRIIHSADQHLDSGMNTHLSENKANERRAEILNTFVKMVEYAVNNSVSAILLSGDLFDTVSISANVQNLVTSLIKNNLDIMFYYLKGNHDNRSFLTCLENVPDNLKLFDDGWRSYHLTEKIVISGVELSGTNCFKIYDDLILSENDINICMLHGQVSNSESDININVNKLSHKSIDYLALGHIHSYKKDKLDGRGIWCYSGCLEGRGFDEPGDKGFVMLMVDEDTGRIVDSFVPFAGRKVESYEIDMSGVETDANLDIDSDINSDTNSNINSDLEAEEFIRECLARNGADVSSIVDIKLVGAVNENVRFDTVYLTKRFEDKYYYIRFKDETTIKVNYKNYINDVSLKGEFVRSVLADDNLSEDEKGEIITVGLRALKAAKKEDIISYICKE